MRAVPYVPHRCDVRGLRVPQTIGAVGVRDVHQRGSVEDVRQLIAVVVVSEINYYNSRMMVVSMKFCPDKYVIFNLQLPKYSI